MAEIITLRSRFDRNEIYGLDKAGSDCSVVTPHVSRSVMDVLSTFADQRFLFHLVEHIGCLTGWWWMQSALVIEVVVKGSMHGCEFLQRAHPLNRCMAGASSERLVRVPPDC